MKQFATTLWMATLALGAICYTISPSTAQSTSTNARPCSPQPLEDFAYPEELEPHLDPSVRSAGMRALQSWNDSAGVKVSYLRPTLMNAFRLKQLSPNYAQYKTMIFVKLELFEKFNIASCLEIPGMPSTRDARRRAVEAEFTAFENQIREVLPPQCPKWDLYSGCLCKVSLMTQGCDAAYARTTANCSQIPLRDRVIRSLPQTQCALSCSGGKLYPSEACSCSDIGEMLTTAPDGSCEHIQVPPNRGQQKGCISDEPFNADPRAVLEPRLCLNITGIPAESQCEDTAKLLSSTNVAPLPDRTRRMIQSSFSLIDQRLSVSSGNCSSPTYPVEEDKQPMPKEDENQTIQDFIRLSGLEQRVIEQVGQETFYREQLLPGDSLDENPSGLDIADQMRLHNAQRTAKVLTAKDAIDLLSSAIGATVADIEHARAEKRLALVTMKEFAAKSRLFEEKKLKALFWKNGLSIAITGLALFPVTTPVALALTVAGAVIPSTAERLIGPEEERLIGAWDTAVKNSQKEIAKTMLKGERAANFQGLGVRLAERASAFCSMSPALSANLKASGQLMRDSRLIAPTLKVLGGYAAITADSANIGKVAGKVGAQGVSILFSWMDTQTYLERDVSTENPYEWAMRQQEVGIRGINRRIAIQKQSLSDLKSLRTQWINKLRAAYCTPPRHYDHASPEDQLRYKWTPPAICTSK